MPNKVVYGFSPKRPLDLYLAIALYNIYVAHTNTTNVISFALINYKEYYDKSHKSRFIKVKDWTMLKFHKRYSIFSSVGVTKKLTQ